MRGKLRAERVLSEESFFLVRPLLDPVREFSIRAEIFGTILDVSYFSAVHKLRALLEKIWRGWFFLRDTLVLLSG